MTYKISIAALVGLVALSMMSANTVQGSTLPRTQIDTTIPDRSRIHGTHEPLAEDDDIYDVVKEMTEGVKTLGLAFKKIRDSTKNLDKPVIAALDKTLIIAGKKGKPIAVEEDNVSEEAIQDLLHVKNSLRISQHDLFSMADKTVKACEEIIIYMDGWDSDVNAADQKVYLQEQLNIITIMLETAKTTLAKTKTIYDDSIVQLDVFESRLHSFARRLEDMLDGNSSAHKKWTENVKLEIYSRMENCSTENSTTGEVSKDSSIKEILQLKLVKPILDGIKQTYFPEACPGYASKAEISRIETNLQDMKGTVQSATIAVSSSKDTLNEVESVFGTKIQTITKWIGGANEMHKTIALASDNAFRQLIKLRGEFHASVDSLATEGKTLIQMYQQ